MCFFSSKNLNLERLEKTNNLVAFCIKLAACSCFQRNSRFFPNTQSCFRNLSFLTRWKISLIQSHSFEILLSSMIFKKIVFFLKTYLFFLQKNWDLKFLRDLNNSVAFYSKFAAFIIFLGNRIFFCRKDPSIFLKKNTKFPNNLRILTFSVAL